MSLTYSFRASFRHDVKTVGVQAGKANHLSDALNKHTDYWNWYSTDLSINRPSIYQYTSGCDESQRDKCASQAVLRYTLAARFHPFLDCVISITSAKECPNKVAYPRSQENRQASSGVSKLNRGFMIILIGVKSDI